MKRPRSRSRASLAAAAAAAEEEKEKEQEAGGSAPPGGSDSDGPREVADGDERVERLRERAGRAGPRGPGSGGKGRSRRERELRTNWRVPAGHERKIAAKIRASRAKRRRQQRPGAGPRSAPNKVEESADC